MSAQGQTSYEVRAKSLCTTCGGSGRLNDSGTPCPSCRGEGAVIRWVSLQEALAATLMPPVTL